MYVVCQVGVRNHNIEMRQQQILQSEVVDLRERFEQRRHVLRASGRDALATLEYTWAAIESYEQGGILLRPHPLPTLKGNPITQNA